MRTPPQALRAGDTPCWDFISDNRADFGVQRLCRILGVSRSGYYRHQATAQARAERQAEEAATVAEIRDVHAEHQGVCGAPRVHAELRARGRRINRWGCPRLRGSVTRLMRSNHIVGKHLRRKKRTTIPDRAAPPVPDLMNRDFTAPALDTKWCGEITCIPVGSTWLYLATVIDICSRRVVGWSIAGHMRTQFVTDAIEMAVAARGGRVDDVVFHMDKGAQYSAAPSRTPAVGTAAASAWAVSGRATTTHSPSRPSRTETGVAARTALDLEGTDAAGAVSLAVVLQPTPLTLRARLSHTDRIRTATDRITYAVACRMKPGVHSRG
ncbi:IS3 family transposase [Streptomyces sp. GD-15H]|uniref:IS3 family transposase n=1 Tax=Streptomyces sp. GD-15H TaxID=3129112 RepID=UPI00324B0289